MTAPHLIPASEFCQHHHIEISFIHSLQDYGLAEITMVEDAHFINEDQLEEIEKMIRLHYDLKINFEGLDAIRHLLEHIQSLHHEMSTLRNRLQLYEGSE